MSIVHFERRLGGLAEHFITATPERPGGSAFAPMAGALRRRHARILLERVFAQSDALDSLGNARRTAYGEIGGDLDDGVAPTWLRAPAGRSGACAGVQVHAVSGPQRPLADGRHLRVLRVPGAGLATVSGLGGTAGRPAGEQIREAFADLAGRLAGVGSRLDRTARTWLWTDPIERWYGDLNRERNTLFRAHGLIAADGRPVYLPASTGIGLAPAAGDFALEAIAALDGPAPQPLAAGGNQECALNYGSAFSRAATLAAPTGPLIYVSGTAAIDAAGRTTSVGDRLGQVQDTIRNVRALLDRLGIGADTIVQGVAYGVDAETLGLWHREDPGWPLLPVLADICRPDLLFEIELVACPGAQRVVGEG